MMDRLAVGCVLRNWVFAATTAHLNLIYNITLLGLESRPVPFVWLGGMGDREDCRMLAVLPPAHPEKKALHIGLLSSPSLLNVFVSPHLGLPDGCGQKPTPPPQKSQKHFVDIHPFNNIPKF